MKRGGRLAGLLLAGVWLLVSCGGETELAAPAGENAALREVRYYSRAYGEDASEDTLLRTVRFSEEEDGIVKESYNEDGVLYAKDLYDAKGQILRSESYLLDDNGKVTETDSTVYTLENGLCVKEETFEDGEPVLSYTREYDAQGNLSYEQLYRIREGERELQYTHHFESSYDEAGRLVEQIYTCDEEPAQNTHFRYEYNESGQLVKQAEIRYEREYAVTEYTRDAQGNVLEERKSEDGVQQSESRYQYEYDGEGRVLRREDLTATPPTETEFEYDGEGRCVSTTDSTDGRKVKATSFTYESEGGFPVRVTQTTVDYGGETPEGEIYTTVYGYQGETTAERSALLLTLAV